MLQKPICNILFVYRYIDSHKRMSNSAVDRHDFAGTVGITPIFSPFRASCHLKDRFVPNRSAIFIKAKQKRSIRVNPISDGSPSRIRRVRRISLGITTRPSSSILRTMPVAFKYSASLFSVSYLHFFHARRFYAHLGTAAGIGSRARAAQKRTGPIIMDPA